MHHKHAPVRKANSAGLQRQAAVYYSENQDSSDIALKPSQKTKAFRKKRAMSVPSQDTHIDVCIIHVSL